MQSKVAKSIKKMQLIVPLWLRTMNDYRFININQEPTEEQLSQLMHEVAEEAKATETVAHPINPMNTNCIIPVNKEHLLLMQVLCWLAPGIVITKKGVMAMLTVADTAPQRVWWLTLIAVAVMVCFSLMFNNFIKRYTARILHFPERKKSLFAFFDLKGYILILFMMGLGISLKYIPGMPAEFFAGFYPGLGIALSIAGVRFFHSWCRQIVATNL